MKKTMMTLAAAFVAVCASAQVYVGGNVGFTRSSQDNWSNTQFTILPEIGYNLGDNLAIGIEVGYGQNKEKDEVTNGNLTVSTESKVSRLVVNPYVRYTFYKSDLVSLFCDGRIGYEQDKVDDTKTNNFGIGVAPGVALNLSDKVSLVAHLGWLGYMNSKKDVDGAKAVNTFGINAGSSDLSLGFYYNF